MTVLQIHEEMAFAVMSFCPCLIGTKSLFESLDLTPKAVSKYFNKVRTGHKFVGPGIERPKQRHLVPAWDLGIVPNNFHRLNL
jgi:hypothetical protein